MLGDFDYRSLTYESREAIHNALAVTTVKHITRGEGLFSPMPFDPAQSPSQMLETVHLEPAPSTLAEVHALADIAANGPLAEVARQALRSQPAYLAAVRFLMDERRENIVSATTHVKNIADVAIWQSAWVEELDQEDWQERNGLGISRGVTTIQAFGMAASEVVQKMGHVFLSFPRTKTTEGLDIVQSLIDTNNRNMRAEMKAWMGAGLPVRMRRRGGKAIHLGWEGSTADITYGDDHKPESLILGRIADGTIDLVKHALVQPVVILEEPEPVVVIGDITEVKKRRDVDRVQAWQSQTLARIMGISSDKITVGT